MSRWFRSEHMEYISLIVNEDAAHDCLADLGKLSAIQFTDLNPDLTPFQRRYVSFVRRCDELERKLRFFGNECDNFGLSLETAGDVESFLESAVGIAGRTGSGLSAGIAGGGTNGGGKGASGTQLLESLEVELEGECSVPSPRGFYSFYIYSLSLEGGSRVGRGGGICRCYIHPSSISILCPAGRRATMLSDPLPLDFDSPRDENNEPLPAPLPRLVPRSPTNQGTNPSSASSTPTPRSSRGSTTRRSNFRRCSRRPDGSS
jgi:hypothetical protein